VRTPTVKHALSRIWVSRISIWDEHLAQTQSVEQLSPIIGHIMQHHSFTPRETQSESPLLPLDQVPVDGEGHSLRLVDNQRLQVSAYWLFLKFVMVLLRFMRLIHRIIVQLESRTGREPNNFNQLLGPHIKDRRKWKRSVIMIRTRVLGACKQIALH